MCGSKGGGGGGAEKSQKNIGFLSSTDPDSMKNHKATKSAFNVGLSSTLKAMMARNLMDIDSAFFSMGLIAACSLILVLEILIGTLNSLLTG